MELFPQDELKTSHSFNFAPMIDFLFLMLALFATLSISRASLFDAELQLVQVKPQKESAASGVEIQQVNISVSATGNYKWLTEFQQYPMESVAAIQEELARQLQTGALPKDKALTEILLHIDRSAPWESVAKAIFGMKEVGFSAHPVYEPLN
jgi:biopolymer transport protein ExbD